MHGREIRLPYHENALQPVLSASSIVQHVQGHHLEELRRLTNLVRGTPFEYHPLEEIISETRGSCNYCGIFNSAAHSWNHALFWNSLGPTDSAPSPRGRFKEQIERDYGSLESLKKHMCAVAEKRFGSGWLWLVEFHGRLEACTTANAETLAVTPDARPILAIDLWEHAYYLDWRCQRGKYLQAVLDHLVDWTAASIRFDCPLVPTHQPSS